MEINTRYFGQVNIPEEKVLHFDNGLFGFEDYKDYTIMYDSEDENEAFFSWLQSTTEPGLAFPIVDPLKVMDGYNPVIEDEWIQGIGECTEDNILILVLATVPEEVAKSSVNLKAPLIINSETRKGIQLVVENEDYQIKHYLFEDKAD